MNLTEAQVGAAFRRLREGKGWSQEQVAIKARALGGTNCDRQMVHRLESGQIPRFPRVVAIASALGTTYPQVINYAALLAQQEAA